MRVVYDERAWDIEGIAEFDNRDSLVLSVGAEIGSELFPFSHFTVMGGLSDDAIPEASEITILQSGHSLEFPATVDQALPDLAGGEQDDISSVVLASDPTKDNRSADGRSTWTRRATQSSSQ